jgi:hypothetical protein
VIVDVILRCYPRKWRERYETELRDIVATERLAPGLILDLLAGALDARLHPNLVSLQGNLVLKPAGGLPLLSGKYPERRTGGQVALGVFAWLGWTALAYTHISGLSYILGLAGLLPHPLQEETGAWSGLLWLQLFGGPIVGHVVIRGLVHAGARWRHGPRTLRGWVLLAILGTVGYSLSFSLLWLVGIRPD